MIFFTNLHKHVLTFIDLYVANIKYPFIKMG